MKIEKYESQYESQCLSVFMKNVPDFFAPNEVDDFTDFLHSAPETYKILLHQNKVIGSFGVTDISSNTSGRISWIMLTPDFHGKGVGRQMINNCIETAIKFQLETLNIAASHISKAFFSKFGAKEIGFVKNGWGPNMHRVDMILPINCSGITKIVV